MAHVFIDYATSESAWWRAARERQERTLASAAPTADEITFLRVMREVYGQWGTAVRIEVEADDARAFERVASTLPGWDDDPVLVDE